MHSFLKNKRLISTTSIVVLLVVVGVFGLHTPVRAGIFDFFGDAAAKGTALVLGGFIALLVQLIGGLVVNLMWLLLAIAQYNQFLASTAVTQGWVVVRDVVNMFFVVVLLAIAIGTILQQQQYSYAQALPKFIAAAVLVNFSKTICGLFIDFGQIVMMTFVGAFSQAGGGNFAVLIGLNRLLSLTVFGSSDVKYDGLAALSGLVLALIFVSLALIVIGVMVAILVIRIIALWFLIILSPAAFFLSALPNDRGYASKWWDQFINYLLVGPVMAFFLWLSFTVVAVAGNGISDSNNIYIATELGVHFEDRKFLASQLSDVGKSGISTIGGMAGYILGIGLLIGSLMAAQQLSSVGGSIAGGAVSGFKDYMTGKRGPFNPIRTAREVGGTLKSRYEARRKQRVERMADVWERRAGVVAEVGRKVGQRGARWAMETPIGQQARRAYQNIEQGADALVSHATGGALGVGRPFADRIAQEKLQASRDEDSAQQAAQTHLGNASTALGNIRRLEEDRDAAIAHAEALEAASGGPTAASAAERATAATHQTAIDGLHVTRNTDLAEADRLLTQQQNAQFRGLWASIRKGFAGALGSAVRTAAYGWTGAGVAGLTGAAAGTLPGTLLTSAYLAPPALNQLGILGREAQLSAYSSQASHIEEGAKHHSGLKRAQIEERMSGADAGYNTTDEDNLSLLLEYFRKGGVAEDHVEDFRLEIERLGANQGTKDLFEKEIAERYPLQRKRPPTTAGEVRQAQYDTIRKRDVKTIDARPGVGEVNQDFVRNAIGAGALGRLFGEDAPEALRTQAGAVFATLIPDEQRDGMRQLQPKGLDAAIITATPQLMQAAVTSGTVKNFFKDDVTTAMQTAARTALHTVIEGIQNTGAHLDPAGNLTPEYVRLFNNYAEVGGDTANLVGMNPAGGNAAHYNPAIHDPISNAILTQATMAPSILSFTPGQTQVAGGRLDAALINSGAISAALKSTAKYENKAQATGRANDLASHVVHGLVGAAPLVNQIAQTYLTQP